MVAPFDSPQSEVKESITGALRPIKNRRRLSPIDIEAVCRLIAEKRLTDREACLTLDINERTWFRWKQKERNNVRFSALIERLRGQRIDTLISRVDDASRGVNMKQPDWRAADRMLQYIDRDRYGDQKVIASQTVVNNTHNNFLFLEAARKIYGGEQLAPMKPVKQLDPPKSESESMKSLEGLK